MPVLVLSLSSLLTGIFFPCPGFTQSSSFLDFVRYISLPIQTKSSCIPCHPSFLSFILLCHPFFSVLVFHIQSLSISSLFVLSLAFPLVYVPYLSSVKYKISFIPFHHPSLTLSLSFPLPFLSWPTFFPRPFFHSWAPCSFPFGRFRSFPFFKRNVPFFSVLFCSFFEFLSTYETQKDVSFFSILF